MRNVLLSGTSTKCDIGDIADLATHRRQQALKECHMLDDTAILFALAFLGTVLGVLLSAVVFAGAWHAWSSWTDSPEPGIALEPDLPLLQRIQRHHADMSIDTRPTMVRPWRQHHLAGS